MQWLSANMMLVGCKERLAQAGNRHRARSDVGGAVEAATDAVPQPRT